MSDPNLPSNLPVLPEVLPEGTVVGRHRVSARLRDGGMAIVYVGEHVETEARVAIKVLRGEFAGQPDCVARFDREAKVMGRLTGCPQIVGVHDVGSLPDGRRYTVMDFIRGTDLDDLLAELSTNDETMTVLRVCSIMCDVAAGLETAHSKQIVHRDLKPANIMVERQRTGDECARIVDFGVSADLRAAGVAQELTAVGSVIGTPEYMAPEQAAGISNAPTVDVYAMGIVCLEMLTLRKPPPQGWKMKAPRASELRAEIPPSLQSLLDRMLEHDSTRRIQSAGEVRLEFAAIRDSLVGSSPQPSPPPAAVPHASASGSAPQLQPSVLLGGVRAGELSSQAGAAGATVPAPGRASRPAVLVAPALGARPAPDKTMLAPPKTMLAPPKTMLAPPAGSGPAHPSSGPAPVPAPAVAAPAPVPAGPVPVPVGPAPVPAHAGPASPPGATRAEMLAARPPPGMRSPPVVVASSVAAPSVVVSPAPVAGSPPSRAAELLAAAAREAEVRAPVHPPSAHASTAGAPHVVVATQPDEPTSRAGLWITLAALGFVGLLVGVWFLVRP